jgi:hypothetical protein
LSILPDVFSKIEVLIKIDVQIEFPSQLINLIRTYVVFVCCDGGEAISCPEPSDYSLALGTRLGEGD